jgi:hypothetical protein
MILASSKMALTNCQYLEVIEGKGKIGNYVRFCRVKVVFKRKVG